jgi:ParB-like chromosome segregation protein Spo0J
MSALKFHPLANLFPLIEGEEFEALRADVKAHGLRESITLLGGAILDGRNRYRACQRANVKPRFVDYDGADPLAFVISANVHRRHLTASQRAMAARRAMTTKHGGDRKSDQAAKWRVDSDAASKLFRVGVRSIERASVVLDKGIPELVSAVDRAKITVGKAATVAKRPASDQQEWIADKRKAEAKWKPAAAPSASNVVPLRVIDGGADSSAQGPISENGIYQEWNRASKKARLRFVKHEFANLHALISEISDAELASR